MSYTIDTVLFATELEPRSSDIFRHAVGIAQRFGARLHVITVFQSGEMPLVSDFISHDDLDKVHAEKVERVRADFRERIDAFHTAYPDLDARSVIADIQVMEGNAAKAILKTAERIGADLIVLGSHGHSALAEMLGGSVAHKVTLHSNVPVLLVPINH